MKNISLWFFCVLTFSVTCSTAQIMMKQLESSISCVEDSDCKRFSKDSLCLDNNLDKPGKCYCFKDFIPQQNKTHYQCLPTPTSIEDPCEKDIQCQYAFSNWSVCRNRRCTCVEGSHFLNNKCYQTVRLGDICIYSQECLLKNNKTASCQSGKCACGFLQHPVSGPDGESCATSRELGEYCQNDDECLNENTRCYQVCRCRPGYTTSGDGRSCLRQAEKLGARCMEDPECESISDNVYCENYNCRCRNHHHDYLNKCYRNAPLNGTCSDSRECWLNPTLNTTRHCKEGICTCTIKFTDDGRDCVNTGFKSQESYFVVVSGVAVLIWQLRNML